MSLIDFIGFEMGLPSAITGSGWAQHGAVTAVASGSNVRTGANSGAYNLNSTARGGDARALTGAEEHATLIAGVAFFSSQAASVIHTIMDFGSDTNATVHVTICTTATGKIEARRGTAAAGTLLGDSGANVLTNNTYYYVEAKVTLSDSVGVVHVKVNGTSWINLTGQDTKNAGTKTVLDTFSLGKINSSSANARFDDLYLLNGDGTAPNDFMGAIAIYGLFPTANGASSQWLGSDGNSVNNFQQVDDTGGSDFNVASTAGFRDLYGIADLPAQIGSGIKAVQIVANVQNTDGALRQLKLLVNSNSTISADSGQSIGAGTANLIRRQMMLNNPTTAAPWTVSDVNNMEIGQEVV